MAKTMIGSRTRLTIASRQLIHSMKLTMPMSFKPSRTIVIAPAANISFSTSTSVVTRETTLPTGVWSKKRIGKRWMRSNTATRRSASVRCATTIVRYCWP